MFGAARMQPQVVGAGYCVLTEMDIKVTQNIGDVD